MMDTIRDYLPALVNLLELVKEYPWITAFGTTALTGTGIFSFLRRSKTTVDKEDSYFSESQLLSPPIKRPAYSDRMAYVLAEMSSLAYYQFEGSGGFVKDAVKNFLSEELDPHNEADIHRFLEKFSADLIGNRPLSTDVFRSVLESVNFELLDTINVEETQGFACKRIAPNEDPYIVIAFRGTEKKVSDWLTDARAVPTQVGATKVHTGFFEALKASTGEDGKTALDKVKEVLDSPETKDANGEPLRLFITGHSLGGALALLTTKLLAPDVNGACYTFGAPRIANYEYFERVKTPVYRVVNSSDIVPRVPPGAVLDPLLKLLQMLSWLTSQIPVIPVLIDKLDSILDKLNGYRHFGDLRFLTDVAAGRFHEVKLLRNPPAVDRILWFWKRVVYNFFTPVQSHSMTLYRKKLSYVAHDRNNRK